MYGKAEEEWLRAKGQGIQLAYQSLGRCARACCHPLSNHVPLRLPASWPTSLFLPNSTSPLPPSPRYPCPCSHTLPLPRPAPVRRTPLED